MITQRPSPSLVAGVLLLGLLAGPVAAATLELSGPAGATIALNDRALGTFPMAGPLDLPPGSYTVRCHLAGHVPYAQTVRLVSSGDWQHLAVRLLPYSRRTAWSSNLLLAGLGQHYLGQNLRGYAYNALEVGGLLTALAGELQRSNLKSDYAALVDLYSRAINAAEVARLADEAEATYTDMKDMESLRDTGLIVAGGTIVISIVDALLSFPGVAGGGGPVPVDTAAVDTPWSGSEYPNAVHAGLRLAF